MGLGFNIEGEVSTPIQFRQSKITLQITRLSAGEKYISFLLFNETLSDSS